MIFRRNITGLKCNENTLNEIIRAVPDKKSYEKGGENFEAGLVLRIKGVVRVI